jgi:DNA processing protein
MDNDLLYQIALTQVPQIGDVHAKSLIQVYQEAAAVFKAPRRQLESIEGIGSVRAQSIKNFRNFKVCEEEVRFIEKFHIKPLFINSPGYPKRLLNCYDSPALLYYRGNANLNAPKVISVVGTRNHSDYGKWICEKIMEELKGRQIQLVSGLAFGIDTIAHKAALKNNMETIAVLAHGLDRIYPLQNKSLAKQMLDQGGLLTDFRSGTNPDKQNFPRRNRITAGICDALLVIESGKKGGSLITAELANSYNKDVFAIPGRVNDLKSEGCLYLVKSNKASLVTCGADLLEIMAWGDPVKPASKKQRELFIELSPEEKIISDLLTTGPLQLDDLYQKTGLSISSAASALLMLEMNGVVVSLPGKLYKLI